MKTSTNPIHEHPLAGRHATRSGYSSFVFSLLLLLVAVSSSFAQGRVNRYVTTTFSGSFSDISSSGTYFSVSNSDDGYAGVSLPFAFNYDSTLVSANTTVNFSTNGWINLNGSTGYYSCCSNWVGSTTSGPAAILPFCVDLVQGGQYYQTTGSAPNRVFTIEFYNFECFSYSTTISMQVKLYETSNTIEMLYSSHGASMGGNGAGTGLNGFSSPTFVYQSYASGETTSPSTDIRWTTPAPPIPPTQLSLSPHSINFGGIQAGSSTTATITASSVGANNLHITGYSVSGASADYTVLNPPHAGDSIVAGKSATYTVQFSPIAPGSRIATFSLYTDGRDSGTQSTALIGSGLAPGVSYGKTDLFRKYYRRLGDTSAVQYFPITSTGTGPLTLNSVYIIGANSDNYKVIRIPSTNPLPVGVTDSIGIRFTPKFEGRPDAAVVVSTNAYNMPWDTVALYGVGILARLQVLPPAPTTGVGNDVSMSFDSVALGDSVCKSVTLTNPGSDTLYLLKQSVSSADYDFSFFPLTGSDTMLVPGQSKIFSVCFHPLKTGTRVAAFRIFTNIPKTFESTPRDTSVFVLNVTGVGAAYGRIALLGNLADSVIVDSTDCITASVQNSGQTQLTITSGTISGLEASEYAISWPEGAPSFTLAPGATKAIKICFTPGDRGDRSATLTLSGQTSGEPVVDSFQLGGFGLHVCTTPIPTAIYDTVLVGMKDTKMAGIQNCGDVQATDNAAIDPSSNPAFALSGTTTATEASGGTAEFAVVFQPTVLGDVSGTLNVTGLGVLAGTTVPLHGYGTGVLANGMSTIITVANGDCQNDTVVFTNNGNIDWTPGDLMLGGADAGEFTAVTTTMTPATLAPGASGYVVLTFCPKADGAKTVTIDFPSSSPMANVISGSQVPYTLNANSGVAAVAIHTQQNGFVLGQSYPNPAVSGADVVVTLPTASVVKLELLDATGNSVRSAFSGHLSAGDHTLTLDAKGLSSGIYYYVLTSGEVRLTRQMVLVK